MANELGSGRWCVARFGSAWGAVDVRGGGPLGEDFRVAAETVGDGGIVGFQKGAGFDDEDSDASRFANGVDLVFFLFAAFAVDEGEIGNEVIDEA